MWIFDCSTLRFLEVNDAAINTYGYSKEEFLQMSILDIRLQENYNDVNSKNLLDPETHTLETRHFYKNRELVDVSVTTFPFSFEGTRSRLVYVGNVTTKKKRESLLEFLNKAGEELSLTLNTQSAIEKVAELIVPKFANWFSMNLLRGEMLEPQIIKHEDQEYVRWAIEHSKQNPVSIHDNSIQGHIMRTGESSLVPLITNELIDASIKDKVHRDVLKGLNLRSSITVPMKIRNKIIGTVSFISTIEGKQYDQIDLDFAKDFATRIALTLENARLHEESQKEIEQRVVAENKKDEFIGVASHELKTPMTTINASIQMIDRIYGLDPQSDSIPLLLEKTKKGVSKLSGLITELLNVSKIEGGQLKLNKTHFKLSQIVYESCNHVHLLGSHSLKIEGDLELEVFADAQRLDQVIVNIVNNAVKYSPSNSEIKILIEGLHDAVKLSVSDQGVGISEEKLPYIFDRYFRVDNSGIQYSGLGLGLYISSEIIRMHGGQIGVISEPAKGSTFWFTLPSNQ